MPNIGWLGIVILGAGVWLTGTARGEDQPLKHRNPAGPNIFHVTVPPHPYDLLLARPEAHSVTLSVLNYADTEGFALFGTQPGTYTRQTPVRFFPGGVPATLAFTNLSGDTSYYYQFRWGRPGTGQFTASPEYSFHTARPTGSGFTFTMTADVHLDEHTSAEVYEQSLANIRASRPDFHLDLGNLFMTDKHATRSEAAQQYLAQRYYLGQIGTGIPLLLALGVHDGESSRYNDGTANSLAVWANNLRKTYYPNPVPDTFYTGNAATVPFVGPPENYYSWTWGDALFVVLDPYRYSLRRRGNADGWGWSLGLAQYEWLQQTLAHSRARYKFVCLHNLLAGDQASRGGVELAGFNEWGGRNLDGTEGFAEHRPGWAMPIHELLRQNGVTAVFKAHDNFYARQEKDGILYLMVPQPSFAGDDRLRDLENYGYRRGVFRGNSGHVRVTVSPAKVTVDYIRTVLPEDETASLRNNISVDHYEISAPPNRP